MSDLDLKDIEALDVRGKLVVVKTNDTSEELPESVRKTLVEEHGVLGIILLPRESDISSLGIGELENILNHLKKHKND